MCFFLVGVRTRCPLLIQDNTYSHISQDCSILFSILLYSIFYFHLPFFWVSPHNRLWKCLFSPTFFKKVWMGSLFPFNMTSTLTLDWNLSFKFSRTSTAKSNRHFQFWSHDASLLSFNPLIATLPLPPSSSPALTALLVLSAALTTTIHLFCSMRSISEAHEHQCRVACHCPFVWHNLSTSSQPVSWFQPLSLSSGLLPWATIWLSMCLNWFPNK